MNRKIRILFLLFLFQHGASATSGTVTPTTAGTERAPEARGRQASLRSKLATYFERLSQFGFSGSVLLAKGADLVFVDAHGQADRENPRPFLPTTVVTIGSITKPFTAAQAHVRQGDGRFYGYGWEIGTTPGGGRDICHSGGNGYFAADFHWLPDEGYMYFVGSNDASQVNLRRLSDNIQGMIFGQEYLLPPAVVPVPVAVLRRYEGRYRLPNDAVVVVTEADGALVLSAEGSEAMQAVLGGDRTLRDKTVRAVANRSRELVEAEFKGDFNLKFQAMGGTVPLSSLRRYHGYDREVWDQDFGDFRGAEIVAAAGQVEEVQVVVRMNFARGAAAQVHTWRDDRLANVSVVPDWERFEFRRTVFPVSESEFESFSTSTSLRLTISFEPEKSATDSGFSLLFRTLPNTPRAKPI